jgi:hypothetical protein
VSTRTIVRIAMVQIEIYQYHRIQCTIEIERDESIDNIKAKIQDKLGIPPHYSILRCTRSLNEYKEGTLPEYKLEWPHNRLEVKYDGTRAYQDCVADAVALIRRNDPDIRRVYSCKSHNALLLMMSIVRRTWLLRHVPHLKTDYPMSDNCKGRCDWITICHALETNTSVLQWHSTGAFCSFMLLLVV